MIVVRVVVFLLLMSYFKCCFLVFQYDALGSSSQPRFALFKYFVIIIMIYYQYLGKNAVFYLATDRLGLRRAKHTAFRGEILLSSRAPNSWWEGRRFDSRQERRENLLLHSQLSVLTLISVSSPPACYHSSM